MNNQPKQMSPRYTKTIATLGTVIGVLAGSIGMWLTLEERSRKARVEFEESIKDKVTKEIRLEVRLTKLEERIEAVRAEMRDQRQMSAASSALAPLTNPATSATAVQAPK